MAAWRSTTPLNTPRLSRRFVRTAKKPSTALSQEALVGVKLEGPAGIAAQPSDHLSMFVSGVVVEDGVDGLAGGDLTLDGVEEAEELLMPVALHAAPDHLAFEHVERSEQGGRPVALIVVRHGPGATLLHRQARLGAVKRLDLGLFVDAEHHGMGGRINVEADDVAHLLGELRVPGELEGAQAVRSQAVGAPDALDRGEADPDRLGHEAGRSSEWSRPAVRPG